MAEEYKIILRQIHYLINHPRPDTLSNTMTSSPLFRQSQKLFLWTGVDQGKSTWYLLKTQKRFNWYLFACKKKKVSVCSFFRNLETHPWVPHMRKCLKSASCDLTISVQICLTASKNTINPFYTPAWKTVRIILRGPASFCPHVCLSRRLFVSGQLLLHFISDQAEFWLVVRRWCGASHYI